jgi:hypothetical protein
MADGGLGTQEQTTGASPASSTVLDTSALSDIADNSNLIAQQLGQLVQGLSDLSAIVLPPASGGTGRSALTAHSVLIGEGTDPVNFAIPSTAGGALVSAGASADPVFGKVVLTQPATLATLTIANNKTLTVNNSGTLAGGDAFVLAIAAAKTFTVSNTLTLAGTDSTTMTFPSTNGTIATLNIAAQTLSGGANVTSNNLGTQTSGTLTINCGTCPLQYVTNGGAFTLAAPSNDGNCAVLVTNNGSAGAITFSGFTVSSSTGDPLTTTNTNKFIISVMRINGTSTYLIKALQ